MTLLTCYSYLLAQRSSIFFFSFPSFWFFLQLPPAPNPTHTPTHPNKKKGNHRVHFLNCHRVELKFVLLCEHPKVSTNLWVVTGVWVHIFNILTCPMQCYRKCYTHNLWFKSYVPNCATLAIWIYNISVSLLKLLDYYLTSL